MATYKAQDINHKLPRIVDAGIMGDIRFDASDAAPDYIGMNRTKGAATSATDWKIYHFDYSGSDVTRIQLAYGSWDDRATYF